MAGTRAQSTAVVWFRRDLRLSDNQALAAALSGFDRVVPLVVWDPVLTSAAGSNRLAFLSGCIKCLNQSLAGQLVIRSGDPARVVAATAAEAGAAAVLATADFGPYGTERDRRVASALGGGPDLVFVDTPYAVAPGTLLSRGGTPFRVFSSFARSWREQGWQGPAGRPSLKNVSRGGLRDGKRIATPKPEASIPAPGEAAGHRALDGFLRSRAGRYRHDRDRPDLDATSRLSPYLKFGCLHPRQVLTRLEPGNDDHVAFETELCWREFYADVLFHRPDAARRAYRPEWRRFEWDTGAGADRRFEAWTEGRTGYPIVDAGMRQLGAKGWMPNRVRMITASFLVKDLHVDWRRGARWFMQRLVDADLSSNQLNWQWIAGSGNDAAPYFRVFNPVTQGRRFDPDGAYVRRWVPELRGIAAPAIHEPWLHAGSTSYPPPLVDHAMERQEALARYRRLRLPPMEEASPGCAPPKCKGTIA
jgi:deoxyribodipyrimidine photo-lyase